MGQASRDPRSSNTVLLASRSAGSGDGD
jgi:hypothetical protein